MSIELGNPRYWFHGNHLLYAFFGNGFHVLINYFGIKIRSIVSLQIMNCVMGAISSVIFFHISLHLTKRMALSLMASLGMVFSFVFWLWHIEAQVYPLGFIFLILSAYILFKMPYSKKKYIIIGLVQSFACLGHISHIIWFIPVLYWMYNEIKNDRKITFKSLSIQYIMTLFVSLLFCYGMVVLFVVKPATLSELFMFLAGSAALSGNISWTDLPTFSRLIQWIYTSAQAFVGQDLQKTFWSPATTVSLDLVGKIYQILLIIVFVIISTVAFINRKIVFKNYNLVIKTCLIWLLVYAIFFSSWEPANITYHQTDLIPFWMLILCALTSIKKDIIKFTLLGITILLLFISTFSIIRALSYKKSNPLLSRMQFIKKHVSDADLIIIDGGWERVYVPYFAIRKYISFNRHRNNLHKRIKSLSLKNSRIFIFSDIIYSGRFQKAGILYKIKNNYIMNDKFSITEIGLIDESG